MWIGRVCLLNGVASAKLSINDAFSLRDSLSAEYHAATGMLRFLVAYANYAVSH